VNQAGKPTFDKLAAPYDRGMFPLERLWLKGMRSRLAPRAHGHTLEIGVGTGANFPFYSDSVCLSAVDESPDMLAVAAGRAASLDRKIVLAQADAEKLAFPSGSFDTVVASLVLCSVVDQTAALQELKRVLSQPGGSLLLLEHMRPANRLLAFLVDLLNVPWYGFNQRCNLNRSTQQAVVQAGFQLVSVESMVGGFLRLIVART
jgi:ubiquinone/menaquinone biosynthesis C-methylase UbiE